jgi:hypothetical protein
MARLATSLHYQERHQEAIEAFRESIPLLERVRGLSRETLADHYAALANCLRKVGQNQQATAAETRAGILRAEHERASEFPLKKR